MRIKRETVKSIKSFVLAFLLMLCLIGIPVLAIGNYSMLSNHGIFHTCERIEYYENMRLEMKETSYEKGIPYGIDRKCLKGVFSNKQIEKDMRAVFNAKKSNSVYIVDTKDIINKIYTNVEKKYGSLSASQKESLNEYTKKVSVMYQKKMHIPGESIIAKSVVVFNRVCIIGIPILVFFAIFLTFWLISTRRITYHGLRYVCYSVLGAGLTLVTGFSGLISNSFIYKFNISNAYMRKFYTYWLGHEMLMQVFSGIGYLLAGAILIYVVYRKKFRYR